MQMRQADERRAMTAGGGVSDQETTVGSRTTSYNIAVSVSVCVGVGVCVCVRRLRTTPDETLIRGHT